MTALFGLPNLLSGQNLLKNAGPTLLSAAEGAIMDLISASPTWGVFQPGSNTPAVVVDSVIEAAASRESPVSEYRLETGSFASYNKVQKSFAAPLVLAKGGTEAERTAFLIWLKNAVNTTTLFDVRWPEGAWSSATLEAYRISRHSHSGVTVIYAECIFKEVRQVPALYYNSSQPSTDTTNAASAGDLPITPTQRVSGLLASAASTVNSVTTAVSNVESNITGTIGKAAGAIRWS